jgi:hypothetical protein
VRSDSRQEIRLLAGSFFYGDREVGRRSRRGDDCGASKNKDEPSQITPFAREREGDCNTRKE